MQGLLKVFEVRSLTMSPKKVHFERLQTKAKPYLTEPLPSVPSVTLPCNTYALLIAALVPVLRLLCDGSARTECDIS